MNCSGISDLFAYHAYLIQNNSMHKPLLIKPLRLLMLLLIRTVSWIDWGFRRISRIAVPYPYKRIGKCRVCGKCCEQIAFEMEKKYFKYQWWLHFLIFYNDFFNHLDFLEAVPEEELVLFKCRLINENGSCGNYFWRPVFCREYPRPYKYFQKPDTLPWCGFSFVDKRENLGK